MADKSKDAPQGPPSVTEIERAQQARVEEALGTHTPTPPRPEPKPDKRDAGQRERDEQAAVEKAVHGITVVASDG